MLSRIVVFNISENIFHRNMNNEIHKISEFCQIRCKMIHLELGLLTAIARHLVILGQ